MTRPLLSPHMQRKLAQEQAARAIPFEDLSTYQCRILLVLSAEPTSLSDLQGHAGLNLSVNKRCRDQMNALVDAGLATAVYHKSWCRYTASSRGEEMATRVFNERKLRKFSPTWARVD